MLEGLLPGKPVYLRETFEINRLDFKVGDGEKYGRCGMASNPQHHRYSYPQDTSRVLWARAFLE